MRVLRSRNVNGLFYEGMHLLDECGERSDSRAGPVVVAPFPVMSVYENPTERVLFDARRDANPFFHLMEGLWMLAGRNDAAFLNRYIANFGDRFAESASGKSGAEASGVIHDAYGHRWMHALGFDQLDAIVNRLRADPQDRQCVLQMWDAGLPTVDPYVVGGMDDLCGSWKTRPCNTHAYFRVRQQQHDARYDDGKRKLYATYTVVLDMTICCRSNDAVWGAHGANAVHFSMLQEYLAGRIGCQVGTLYQLSNNYHSYVEVLDKIGDPVRLEGDDPYENAEVHSVSMGGDWDEWDTDLAAFMKWHDEVLWGSGEKVLGSYVNTWFSEVAERMAGARHAWTHAMKPSARKMAEAITAPDWRRACLEWMDRRAK